MWDFEKFSKEVLSIETLSNLIFIFCIKLDSWEAAWLYCINLSLL